MATRYDRLAANYLASFNSHQFGYGCAFKSAFSLNGHTKPELDTVIRVLGAVGLALSASPKPRSKAG